MSLKYVSATGCLALAILTSTGAAEEKTDRLDRYGDPLPPGAIARLGTVRFRHGFLVSCVAYSPDGKIVASGGAGRALCLWDAATGKLLHHMQETWQIYSLAFSPDGKTLVTNGNMRSALLWDVATGKQIRKFEGHTESVMCLAMSPDGKTLATGSHDQTIRLWDVGTGKEIRQLAGNQGSIKCLAFSKDATLLASGGEDQNVRLWDVATGTELRQFTGHQDWIHTVAFSPDGNVLASGGGDKDGTLRLWDVANGKEIRALGEKLMTVGSVAFSPDGKTLAAGARQKIILFDPASGKEIRQWQVSALRVDSVAFSPDGKTLVSGGVWESNPHFWEVATGKEIRPLAGHCAPVDIVAFSGDGKTLFSWGRDHKICQWDLTTGKEQNRFGSTSDASWMVIALAPDCKTIATTTWFDHRVRLWEVGTGKQLYDLGKQEGHVKALAYSPDGNILASSGEDTPVRLWDTKSGKELRRIDGLKQMLYKIAFSPNGKMLAGAPQRGGSLVLWDVGTGKKVREFDVGREIEAVVFSPDGKVLAAAGHDRKVRLFDVATGNSLRELIGHQGWNLYGLAFSPDGKWLASAGGENDDTVRLWELASAREVYCFRGHHSAVLPLSFSPDGRTLASGGGDSSILIWDLTGRLKNGKLEKANLTEKDLEAAWRDLADPDAAKACRALWALTAGAEKAVPYLNARLKPAEPVDRKRFDKLIADLDSNSFAVRDQATKDLEKMAFEVQPGLRKVLEGKPSAEVRARVERILQDMNHYSPEWLRYQRALQVLEYSATPAAREVLASLAKGIQGARMTEEAKMALNRMKNGK